MFQDSYDLKKAKGKVRDEIYSVETGELLEVREWDFNVIVNACSTLIAALMAQTAGYTGASYWAVGSGNPSWDTTPVQPSSTDTGLVAEIGRKAIPTGAFSFIDANGNVTTTPTKTIQIQLTFGANDVNGTWREFAIYGGNASATLGTGLPINHKIHGVITKTNLLSIARTMQFSF